MHLILIYHWIHSPNFPWPNQLNTTYLHKVSSFNHPIKNSITISSHASHLYGGHFFHPFSEMSKWLWTPLCDGTRRKKKHSRMNCIGNQLLIEFLNTLNVYFIDRALILLTWYHLVLVFHVRSEHVLNLSRWKYAYTLHNAPWPDLSFL